MFSKRKLLTFISKILLCIIITLGILIGIKASPNFKQKFYNEVFEKSISFAEINAIYEKFAGSPLPFKDYFSKPLEPVFNEQLSYQEKNNYLDGVKLTVEEGYLIPALYDGLVIFVGEKENYGNTVIINCSNGIDIWYSNIGDSAVTLYENIKKGSLVGNSKDNTIYLVFKKDGQVLNYEEYL